MDGSVLVLGSAGLVGKALVTSLKACGIPVIEIKNRIHVDLRISGSLHFLNSTKISFVFFLACEVGGSKYLGSTEAQDVIWRFNVLMYENVFPYLLSRKIPFIFSSSQLSSHNTSYGRVKLLGEDLTTKSGGKSIQFWNVYGFESINPKSHVVSDWIYNCLRHKQVTSMTNGLEARQFAHTSDISLSLIDLMHAYDQLPNVTHVTSNTWLSMRALAGKMQQLLDSKCTFSYSMANSSHARGSSPSNIWLVQSNIHRRLTQVITEYKRFIFRESSSSLIQPYVSVIFCTSNDDHDGIRHRQYHFLRSLVYNSQQYHASLEILSVVYSPSDEDSPFTQLMFWESPYFFSQLRIIHVPSSFNPLPGARVREYVGKNIAAQRAHGRFLLFTNPDNVFPSPVFHLFSGHTLDAKTMYRSSTIHNFSPASKDPLALCNIVASVSDLCFMERPGLPCPLKSERVTYLKEIAIESNKEQLFFSRNSAGDFMLLEKQKFIEHCGYLEIPQSWAVDTAMVNFLSTDLRIAWSDQSLCHIKHNSMTAPNPNDITQLPSLQRLHEAKVGLNCSYFGLKGVHLPEVQMSSVFTSAFNPLSAMALYNHHHIFNNLEGRMWSGRLRSCCYNDFSGMVFNVSTMCPSHIHICNRHGLMMRLGVLNYLGDLPIVDANYFVWISLLTSISLHSGSRPYVLIEYGGSEMWTLRGNIALRLFHPYNVFEGIYVGNDSYNLQVIQQHMDINRVDSTLVDQLPLQMERSIDMFIINTSFVSNAPDGIRNLILPWIRSGRVRNFFAFTDSKINHDLLATSMSDWIIVFEYFERADTPWGPITLDYGLISLQNPG